MGCEILRNEPSTDPDHLAYEDADHVSRPRTLVTLLGPTTAAHEAALRTVSRHIIETGRRPIICASQLGRDVVVDGTLAIELLPRWIDLPVLSEGEYRAYLERRWNTVLAKWQVTEEITLGESFEGFLVAEVASCPRAK